MLFGKILAEAAMRETKFVTWLPAYGAEVRGGTAYCMVAVSDTEIGSPHIDKADTLIILNKPSLEKFKDRIKNKGLLILNTSLMTKKELIPYINMWQKKVHLVEYPFTDIAIEIGNIRVANMVALGCFIGSRKIVSEKSVIETIHAVAPLDKRNLIMINEKALSSGMQLIKHKNDKS